MIILFGYKSPIYIDITNMTLQKEKCKYFCQKICFKYRDIYNTKNNNFDQNFQVPISNSRVELHFIFFNMILDLRMLVAKFVAY